MFTAPMPFRGLLTNLRIFCFIALIVMAWSDGPSKCRGKLNFRQCFTACEMTNGKSDDIFYKKDGTPCKTVFLQPGTCRKGRCFSPNHPPMNIYQDFEVKSQRH